MLWQKNVRNKPGENQWMSEHDGLQKDIAIIGMSGCFPKSENLETLEKSSRRRGVHYILFG